MPILNNKPWVNVVPLHESIERHDVRQFGSKIQLQVSLHESYDRQLLTPRPSHEIINKRTLLCSMSLWRLKIQYTHYVNYRVSYYIVLYLCSDVMLVVRS